MGKKLNFIILILLVLLSLSAAEGYTELSSSIDAGDTSWMLVSSAFVLLMTPGLSFFYGGMVNKKNIISTMLQSFIALGVISVLWVIVGFSLAFGESFGGIIGNPMTYLRFTTWELRLILILRGPFLSYSLPYSNSSLLSSHPP